MSARAEIARLYKSCPLSDDDLMTNFGLYMRSSALVKFLVLNDLYLRIKDVPGNIIEFGTWYGQNLVIFENLRSIYEPFNKTRKIVGFDTFAGYTKVSDNDLNGSVITEGNYSALSAHKEYLKKLIRAHEQANVLGHINGMHELVEGDVTKTAPQYFKDHPETIVALAYFDMGLYEPTKAGLLAIKPHLVRGSVILMDELTWSEAKGEAVAFKEVFQPSEFKIEKSSLTPMRAIVTII